MSNDEIPKDLADALNKIASSRELADQRKYKPKPKALDLLVNRLRKRAGVMRLGAYLFMTISFIASSMAIIIFAMQFSNTLNGLPDLIEKLDGPPIPLGASVVLGAIIFFATATLFYIMRIALSQARYEFRMADHWESLADALELTEGEKGQVMDFVTALTPRHIQFGKEPNAPMDNAQAIIEKLIDKVPSSSN